MNIQIWAAKKCFDSKKAERWFKERRIKYQLIDIDKYGMSFGELKSVCANVGLENIINSEDPDCAFINYLAGTDAKIQKLYENQYLIKTPVVRNGKSASIGYRPEIWESWK